MAHGFARTKKNTEQVFFWQKRNDHTVNLCDNALTRAPVLSRCRAHPLNSLPPATHGYYSYQRVRVVYTVIILKKNQQFFFSLLLHLHTERIDNRRAPPAGASSILSTSSSPPQRLAAACADTSSSLPLPPPPPSIVPRARPWSPPLSVHLLHHGAAILLLASTIVQ
jgi:hypothetical protein